MRTNPSKADVPYTEPSLRTAEVARALGVSARAIRTWADEGKIACYRTFGGHRLFSASEVRRVLASWGGDTGAALEEPSVIAVDQSLVIEAKVIEASEEHETDALRH
jgi:excisionase family DNA binding protein